MQKNVLEYLENSAKSYPNKIAFADSENEYTYSEVIINAKKIATKICMQTSKINKPVAILVDRNAMSLIGFMGVLYSGNYYVPIDNKMPKQRILKVLEQLQTEIILYTEADKDLVEESISLNSNKFVDSESPNINNCLENKIVGINISNCFDKLEVDESLVDEVSNVKALNAELSNTEMEISKAEAETSKLEINEHEIQKRRNKVLDLDPVYVIFTSGSTGTPKGIVISHRSVIDFTDWMAETFNFSEKDIMGNQAPFYFDLSVKDIYTTLKCGATTHILPKKVLMFPMLLIDYLNERNVTSLIWATSAFNLVSNSKVLEKKQLTTVNKVILGGEALLAKHLNTWKKAMPNIQYVNLYGPTEVTVDCTYYKIDREFRDDEAIPIGKACENKEVLLLDENLQEVKNGMPGEICVRGTGVAKGYFNDFEKTNQVFIQNPKNPYYADIIYRTGDIGVRNKEGLIVFQSRKDGQIKHMGYRIELGEIERAVNGLESIKAAICFYDESVSKIVCIYEGEATDAEIIKYVQECIPKYMYPNILRKLEKMPYNANGKIDRVKLKEEFRLGDVH